MSDVIDLVEIAFEAVQGLSEEIKLQLDEIAKDATERHDFRDRTVLIVSEDVLHQVRENDLEKQGYWYSTVEVTVCGPSKTKCKQLCLEAFQKVIEKFHSLTKNGVGPIHGLARGPKEIGIATFGGFPIKGYCARRTLEIHNTLEP